MARLAVDATAVAPGAKGIGRVARGAAETLAARGVDVVALVQGAAELAAPREVVRARPAVLWEQVGLRRAAREHGTVLTFTERLPVGARGRFVVWLYELPHRRLERSRGLYQRGSDLVTRALWKRSLLAAWHVAAGSRATADELERALPELRGRVAVVYPGLDPRFAPGPGPGRGGRYVLHIGSSDPRDNTATALAAFARAQVDARLLVVGGVRGPAQPGIEFVGRVSDEELVRLYRGAAAYLDTSLYEGFGYQALEALACGAPYVGSNATSLPEVVGAAGLLVDPTDVDGLAAALSRVLGEPGLAEELRRRGVERARTFTWERTADALLALLEERP
ncbi:MAG TPA: glycosyltransferase family 1 protein [Gaiellaceae bacterium]|jgi:glycosyltransferase involved in cell wall biosynthesis|nr:glycosyltransferase family 1 protein [Gaiellaceae bacterium]